MRIMIMLLLFVSATSVHAEVYKCYTLKKVSYQPAPCSGFSDSQDVVKILKQSPQQREEALGRLNAMREEKIQQEQERQFQRDEMIERQKNAAVQQQLDTAQREVKEAREDADRAKRDAESAKRSAEEETKRVAVTYQPRTVITRSPASIPVARSTSSKSVGAWSPK